MNATSPTCPQCGLPLLDQTPQGLCPACLMKGAMSDPQTSAPSDEAFTAQVVAAFPQLEGIELIGIGGMGRVYKARQPSLDRIVALKVLPGDKADHPEWIERFTREARALARLNHPNIVRVHDFGTATIAGHTQPYLMMEFVDGVNLRQAMQAGALSAREALAIVPKLCDALHYAHEHDVLHRDIKPENVLIDSEGRVKLVDFGLAKLRDEAQAAFTLTQSGAKLGTIAYMAPEQIEKPGNVDHRADIYSLGVVFYEMLTGELPLGRFPTPSEASGVDPRLDGVVLRTLEKNRDKRFQDAGEMKSGIEHASTSALPATELPRWDTIGYEYESKARIGSWPLLHIAFTKDPKTGKAKRARGIIAIGMHAQGVVALGLFAYGLFAWGVLSAGLLSMGVVCVGAVASGVLSLGLCFAYGVCAVAPIAVGVTSVGYVAAGVTAWGKHVAAATGIIDPVAARVGDDWMFRSMRWSSAVQSVMLTLIMLIGAFGSWKARKPGGHVLLFILLGLMGPLVLVTSTQSNGTGLTFAQRVEKQRRQADSAALMAKEEARRASQERIRKMQYELTTQASRTDSIEVRNQAIDKMQQFIESDDTERVRAGLQAISWSPNVPVDFTRFRSAIRRSIQHPDPEVCSWALNAMNRAGYEAEDEAQVLAMVPDANRRTIGALTNALRFLSKQDFTGKYGPPMLVLLKKGFEFATTRKGADDPIFDDRDVLGVLWGAKWTRDMEAVVLEWSHLWFDEDGKRAVSKNPIDHPHNVLYFALSVQANKSRPVLERLMELARSPDVTNTAGRVLWGLPDTVADKADYPFVASSVIELLGQRTDDYLWRQGFRVIEKYALCEHVASLEALAAQEAMPAARKERLQTIITALKKQP